MKLFDKLDRYLVDDEYKITIIDDRIHIINYIKIEDFSSNMVKVRHKNGITVLYGNNLVVSKMMRDELLIVGKFSSIEYK